MAFPKANLVLAVFLVMTMAQIATAAISPEQELLNAAKTGPMKKLGPWLANLYDEFQQSSNKKTFQTTNPAMKVRGGKVGIDLFANDAAALQKSLASLGATNIKTKGPLVSAQIPVSALASLASLSSLKFGNPAMSKTQAASQGKVVSQGDTAEGADDARAASGFDGTGVTVGVLSDSYNCNPPAPVPGAPNSTAAQDVASQDVPPNVAVLDNGPCPGTDEGRAMVQLVHDVAPGASQKFHTANNSLLDFALGILQLRAAGANILDDDSIYFAENMFSDGIIAQSADLAVKSGAAYFSSAGNQARLSYESAYREVSVPTNGGGNLNGNGQPFVLHAQNFQEGAGTDTLQRIHVTQDGGQAVIVFSLQWDQPFLSSTTFATLTDPKPGVQPQGATGDLDMLIYNDKGVLLPGCPKGKSVGITCQITGTPNIGGDAVDLAALVVSGPKSKSGDFFIRIVRSAGVAPHHVKYVPFVFAGAVEIVTHNTNSGTAFGHPNAANVAAVGASSWYLTAKFDSYLANLLQDTPGACIPACLNDFSSAGGVPIYLDKYGIPLSSPVVRETPRVTGPDGGNTTFFFADSSFDDDDGDGCNSPTSTFITKCLDNPADEWPNFFGTSASAPHVAGIAALMLNKNKGLAAKDIYGILSSTAQDITKREVLDVPGPGDSVFSPLPVGFDFDSGHGFVNALAAGDATPAP